MWRILEMQQINCKVNIILTLSENCVIVFTTVTNQGTTISIAVIKLYVPFVTLSTQDSAKLLDQVKSDHKRKINWNKY